MPKVLSVFGATGLQGGSLLNYLLNRPDVLKIYRLRGITRDVNKPEAQKLKDAGVEMVTGDMDDKESLSTALAGSSVVFAMTNFWEKVSAEIEVAQGKAMADAVIAAGAEFIIWSSLPNVTQMSGGKITGMKHFDSKAQVEEYVRDLPINSAFYLPAMYMQMMTHIFRPKPDDNGDLIFSSFWGQDKLCPMIDIRDTGKFIVPILLHPENYSGASFIGATAFYTPAQLIQGWRDVTGKEIKFHRTSGGGSNLPPEVANIMKEVVGTIDEHRYYGVNGQKDLEWTLAQMDDSPTTWEDFVKANEPWF